MPQMSEVDRPQPTLQESPYGADLEEIYDFLVKLCLVGDSGVGKSCLMHHFLNQQFRDPSPHTIGVEFSSTLLRLPSSTPASEVAGTRIANSKTLKVQLWDTAGQERFRSVTRNYYRGACGAVLVYDITNRASFNALPSWLTDVRALASPDLAVVVVGNKLDQERQRQVPFLEALQWSKDNDVTFLETSSVTGENVEQPFVILARNILQAIESGKLDPEQPGSGVSYGARKARPSTGSWNPIKLVAPGRGGKCC